MSKRLSIPLAGLLAVALAIAGCGGGGGDDSSNSTSSQVRTKSPVATAEIAKPAFLKQANAICTKDYENNKSGFESFTKGKSEPFSTEEEIHQFADTVLIPNKKRQVRELSALGAPSGDEDQVEAILEAYEAGIATAEEDPRAAVTSSFGVFVEATELAEEYGLEKCRY